MSGTTDRKLEALSSVLTPRQRAILGVQKWIEGERADERLQRLCPPQDRAEMDGILNAVNKGNNDINFACLVALEWIANIECEIHMLRVLQAYQARESKLPAAVRRSLPALPRPWDTARFAHRMHGRAAVRNEPGPATWEVFTQRLVRDIREGIAYRWQDLVQSEAALAEASRALGTDVTHREIRANLDHLRAGVLHLVEELGKGGHTAELPELDAEANSYAKGAFNLHVLREVPPEKHAREWLNDRGLAELEEWERQQAALFGDEE